MSLYPALRALAENVGVESGRSAVRWRGDRIAVDDSRRGTAVIECLTSLLYRQFHCSGRIANVVREVVHGVDDEEFESRLATTVASEEASESARVHRTTYQSPGFVFVRGGVDVYANAPCSRIYLNLSPLGAVRLSDEIVHHLSNTAGPFAVKFAASRGAYWRCDTCVVYLGPELAHAVEVADRLYALSRSLLRPCVPPLARRQHAGVALARTASQSDSFGMLWAEWLATVIARTHQIDFANAELRYQMMIRELSTLGVSLDSSHDLACQGA